MTTLQQQVEQTMSILSNLTNADGTKLLTKVGYPLREIQESDLPYAAIRVNAPADVMADIIICRYTDPIQDEKKMITYIDALRNSPYIAWIGRLQYLQREGHIYRMVSVSCENKDDLE